VPTEPAASKTIYFEEISVGDVFGSPDITITVDRDELLGHNRRYDYWPIHVDPAAAKGAGFSDVIASSSYILSLMLRLFHLNRAKDSRSDFAMIGGVEQRLKIPRPVQPGDVLHFLQTVIETRPSSKPGRGIITVRDELTNQRGEVVLNFEAVNVIAMRPQRPGKVG
jgi:acyl dehydratase